MALVSTEKMIFTATVQCLLEMQTMAAALVGFFPLHQQRLAPVALRAPVKCLGSVQASHDCWCSLFLLIAEMGSGWATPGAASYQESPGKGVLQSKEVVQSQRTARTLSTAVLRLDSITHSKGSTLSLL